MKKALALTAALGLLSLSTTAHAQFFGQMGPLGPTSEHGIEMVGAYVGLATDEIGATGHLRFGIDSEKWDVGVQGGFVKVSNGGPTGEGAQVDLKGALGMLGESKEVKWGGDISAGVSHFGGDFSATSISIAAIPGISIQHPMSGGASVSGWGGFGIAWTHTSVSGGGSGSSSSGELRLGGGYGFSKDMTVVAEFNHGFANGGGNEFLAGINFGLGGK